MVLPDSHGVSRAPRYSGTGSGRHEHFVHGAITHSGQSFQTVRLCSYFITSRVIPNRPHNPHDTEVSRVWAVPLSLATTDGITIVFSSWGYLDVSVPPVSLFETMDSSRRSLVITPGGLPHSEIPGSKLVCSSPRLIAAYHVLHRLLTPRHPPSALSSLISVLD